MTAEHYIYTPSGSVYCTVFLKDGVLAFKPTNLKGITFQIDGKSIPQLIPILQEMQNDVQSNQTIQSGV